jgi:hypothetical protein
LNPEIERQEMLEFLLGTLDGDHKTRFEERIWTEPGVYEELLVVEEELIDQYLAGDLSTLEQQQFENHFLITAERQKNLRFGKMLREYAESHIDLTERVEPPIPVHHKPINESFSLLPAPLRRWPVLAALAAIFACAGIILVRGLVNKREACVLQEANSRVVTVTLLAGSAGTEGSNTQPVIVSPKGAKVKLELELTNPTFRNYKSELFRENKSLQISDELTFEAKGEHRVVPFTVTGEMLSPGDYQVKLSGVLDSGADEFIDNYSFRVIE